MSVLAPIATEVSRSACRAAGGSRPMADWSGSSVISFTCAARELGYQYSNWVSSLGGAEWLLFKILLSGIRSNPKRTRKRATFSRSPYSAGLAYSSPCRSCFSTSTFRVTGSKTSPLLVRMMPSSCAKRAPHPAGSGAFTEFSVILPRAAATSSKKEQPDALPNSGRR